MHTRTTRWSAALLLTSLLITLLAIPGAPPHAIAASCTGWTSESQPPPTIRVLRTASGQVETVDFKAYVKNVLSREWISSWTTESIRAGALAVKNYAWYQVLHYRGYVNSGGQCFDVFDSTRDQHYDPSRPTYGSMASAVDATWTTLALQSGHIFATYYNAGAAGEACGANVNGWRMYQWGSQACGLIGKSAAQIMAVYYAGVTITSAPPPVSPPPSPTPVATPVATPVPTPVPTAPPPPAPSGPGSPAPTTAPTPLPTPIPTPSPTPVPTPPEQPGGGQSGIIDAPAPPPPPPPDPEPIVVTAGGSIANLEAPTMVRAAQPWMGSRIAAGRTLEGSERDHRMGLAWVAAAADAGGRIDARLVTFRVLLDDLTARLVHALARELRGDALLGLLLPAR